MGADRDKTPEEIREQARRELEQIQAEKRKHDQESNQEDK